jgi:hypothetical protein
MTIWRGSFRGKKPTIRFQIAGTEGHPVDVEATVDTGCGWFMVISAKEAKPHALEYVGTTTATMADGRRENVETRRAAVGYGGKNLIGIAAVFEQDCECLVGIDFLRLFNLTLVVSDTKIALITLDEVPLNWRL